jgi:outer membrane protein
MTKFILLIFISISLSGWSQKMITLEEAQSMALENNNAIKNARLDLDIAKQKIWETTAIGLPQINAEGGFQNFLELPTTVLPANAFNPMAPEDELIGIQFGTDYNVTGNITLTQLIFDGRYFVGLQASRAVSDLYKKSIKKSELDAKKSVAQAYYTIVVTQATLKTLEASYTELEKIYASTKKIADAGLLEQTDADQLSITLRSVENNLTSIKNQIEVAENLLKLEMGLELTDSIEVNQSLDYFIADAKVLAQNNFNSSANINYQLVEQQLILSRLNVKNEKAFAMPSLAGFITHQQQAMRNDFSFFESGQPWYPSTFWGLRLTIPIFSSGMRLSKINQSKLEVKKLENSLYQLDNALKIQYQQTVSNFELALTTLENEQQNVAVTEKIMRNMNIKFQERMVSSIELSQAQTQYLNAQANYVNAAYKLINAKLELNYLLNK